MKKFFEKFFARSWEDKINEQCRQLIIDYEKELKQHEEEISDLKDSINNMSNEEVLKIIAKTLIDIKERM